MGCQVAWHLARVLSEMENVANRVIIFVGSLALKAMTCLSVGSLELNAATGLSEGEREKEKKRAERILNRYTTGTGGDVAEQAAEEWWGRFSGSWDFWHHLFEPDYDAACRTLLVDDTYGPQLCQKECQPFLHNNGSLYRTTLRCINCGGGLPVE